jgi:sugar lactone lactonase YvrE
MVMHGIKRRALLALGLPAALGACATDVPAARGVDALISPWRSLPGGYLAPPTPGIGLPPRPGSGMFAKLLAPTALALRGDDLLVLDSGQGRLWRADAMLGTMTGIAGAPTGPEVSIALGADLSAWVLDPRARRVLRFGRDGRLMQTFSLGAAAPGAFALADNGATLLVADAAAARWTETRNPAGPALEILPQRDDGLRVGAVDALALSSRDRVWVLDRRAGAVHAARRDGRVETTLGSGFLKQPLAIGVDAFERVWVLEGFEPALVVLERDRAPRRIDARSLRVQQPAALAVDHRTLALADRLGGTVLLFRLGAPGATEIGP